MLCSSCGSPQPDAAVPCTRCAARPATRAPGRFTPLTAPRRAAVSASASEPALGAGSGGRLGGFADGVTVLEGVLVPPDRQNGPVDWVPEPQPLLIVDLPAPGEVAPAVLRWRDLCAGAWHAAAVLVAAPILVTALVGLASAVLPGAAPHTGPVDWLSAAVTLIVLALGGPARAAAGVELLPGLTVAAGVPLHLTPLLLTAALTGPLAGLAVRDERRRPSPVLGALIARAVVTAGAAAAIVAAAQVAPARTGGAAFGLVLVVTLIARVCATPSAVPGPLRRRGRPVTAAGALAARFGVTLLIGAGVVGATLLLISPSWAVVLPALVPALLGVPVTITAPAGFPDGLALVTRPSWWSLLLLVPAVAALIAAVRHALARPVGAPRHPVGTIVVTTAGSVLLALAGRAGVEGTLTSAPSLPGAAVAGLVWGALLTCALRAAPDLALLFRRAAEASADDSWRTLFYGAARPRAAVVSAVAAALVTPVLAAGGVVVTNQSVFGPERVALAYLRAVSRGDVAAALAARADRADGPLLSAAVLRAPGVDRPERVRLVSAVAGGGRATVTASFTLAGEAQAMSLTLVADTRRYGVFDGWRIVSGLGTVTPAGGALPVTVAGVTLDAGRAVPALPARYPIALADPTGTFSAVDTSVTVLDAAAEAAPGARMSPDAQARVRAALDARLTGCAERPDPFMFDCPFDMRAAHQFFAGSVRYTLKRTAQVEMRASGPGGIGLVTTTPGTVEYRAALLDGTEESGVLDYTVDATATLGGDGAVDLRFTAVSSAPAGS